MATTRSVELGNNLRQRLDGRRHELLPRAFAILSTTAAWIDPVNGWLVVDAASPAKADEVVKLLLKSVDKLPLESLRVQRSPVGAMTEWLQADESPAGFTVDQDAIMRATGESNAQVAYYLCHWSALAVASFRSLRRAASAWSSPTTRAMPAVRARRWCLGVDLYTISKILGHANVQTTQRYAHLQVDAQRLALDKLSALVVAK